MLGNLLNQAHTIIPSVTMSLMPFLRRDQQPNGAYLNVYSDAIPVTGSAQPVQRQAYEMLGLDFNKNYIMVYSSTSISDVGRGTSSDRLRYDNKLFSAVGKNDWTPYDGWNGILFVEMPD